MGKQSSKHRNKEKRKREIKEVMRNMGKFNSISKVLLEGLYDVGSPFHKLRGCQHIMLMIWKDLIVYWKGLVKSPVPPLPRNFLYYGPGINNDESLPPSFYLTTIDRESGYGFPDPSDININMMPFIVGETFEACKLPEKIRPYWAMIKSCLQPEINRAWHHMWPNRKIPSELGKVNYLTIQESWVEEGSTQRRPGLHVDMPGVVKFKNTDTQVFSIEEYIVSFLS